MHTKDNLLLVALVLAAIGWLTYRSRGSGTFGAEEALAKKVICDRCAADGTIGTKEPAPDKDGHVPTVDQRIVRGEKFATTYCPTCQGLGYMMEFRNGRRESAANPQEKKLFSARWLVLKSHEKLQEAEIRVKKAQKELADAEAALKILEQTKADAESKK
jgi:hypothetical protein